MCSTCNGRSLFDLFDQNALLLLLVLIVPEMPFSESKSCMSASFTEQDSSPSLNPGSARNNTNKIKFPAVRKFNSSPVIDLY